MYGVYIRYISYVESKYTVSANPTYTLPMSSEIFINITKEKKEMSNSKMKSTVKYRCSQYESTRWHERELLP